jgi:hypothetical protein
MSLKQSICYTKVTSCSGSTCTQTGLTEWYDVRHKRRKSIWIVIASLYAKEFCYPYGKWNDLLTSSDNGIYKHYYPKDCNSIPNNFLNFNGTQFIASPSNNYYITISVDIGFTFCMKTDIWLWSNRISHLLLKIPNKLISRH